MKIIKEIEGWNGRVLLFEHNKKYYVCSRANTFDRGDETMIFGCNESGEDVNFTDLYVGSGISNENAIKEFCEKKEK